MVKSVVGMLRDEVRPSERSLHERYMGSLQSMINLFYYYYFYCVIVFSLIIFMMSAAGARGHRLGMVTSGSIRGFLGGGLFS